MTCAGNFFWRVLETMHLWKVVASYTSAFSSLRRQVPAWDPPSLCKVAHPDFWCSTDSTTGHLPSHRDCISIRHITFDFCDVQGCVIIGERLFLSHYKCQIWFSQKALLGKFTVIAAREVIPQLISEVSNIAWLRRLTWLFDNSEVCSPGSWFHS